MFATQQNKFTTEPTDFQDFSPDSRSALFLFSSHQSSPSIPSSILFSIFKFPQQTPRIPHHACTLGLFLMFFNQALKHFSDVFFCFFLNFSLSFSLNPKHFPCLSSCFQLNLIFLFFLFFSRYFWIFRCFSRVSSQT